MKNNNISTGRLLLATAAFILLTSKPVMSQYTYNWTGTDNFYISASFLKPFGIEDLVPFGYKLNGSSQIKINSKDNKQYTDQLPVSDSSVFTSVAYMFRDSMVTVSKLSVKDIVRQRANIEKVLNACFKRPDYRNVKETVYSDEDFFVKLDAVGGTLEIISLDHQQLLEQTYPNINIRNYKDDAPFWFVINAGEAVGLEFYNQVSKENNVQPAFRLYYRSSEKLNLKQVDFQLDEGKIVSFPVNALMEKGLEKVTRGYIQYEAAREILRSGKIRLILKGNKQVSYEIPAYQRHSLKTAIQFYKENVTNPLLQYKGW